MDQTKSQPQNSNNEQLSNLEPMLTDTVERVCDMATLFNEKAHEAVASVTQKAEDAASYVGQKTGEASAAVGGGLRSLGDASTVVAKTLETSGRYLQEEGIKDVTEDVTNLIRRYPIPSLIIGAAAGYLVARAMTPRS